MPLARALSRPVGDSAEFRTAAGMGGVRLALLARRRLISAAGFVIGNVVVR